MQGEASSCPADLKPRAIRSRQQGGLELREAHPHGNHDRTLVVWRPCEREGPRYIRAPDERVCKRYHGFLAFDRRLPIRISCRLFYSNRNVEDAAVPRRGR